MLPMSNMSFFKEMKSAPLKIAYPKVVNPDDIKANGLLLTDSEIKKTIETLTKQPDKRFSKQELKNLGLDLKYSIIKDDNRYFVVYKKNVYLGIGSEGKVKLAQYIGGNSNCNWPIGKLLAMKVTYTDSAICTKLKKEQQFLERLGRAHTKIIEREKKGVIKYQFLQEFLPGEDLMDYLDQHPKSVSFKAAINIMYSALSQMRFLHSKGILHCDIKCDNAIYNTVSETIHFIDLGRAMEMDKNKRAYSWISMGTEGYQAPEISSDGIFFSLTYNEGTEIFALGHLFAFVWNRMNHSVELSQLEGESREAYYALRKIIEETHSTESKKRPSANALNHFFENLPIDLQPKTLIKIDDMKMIVRFLNSLNSNHKGWVYDQGIGYPSFLADEISINVKSSNLTDELIQQLQDEIYQNKSNSTVIQLNNPVLLLQLRDAAKKHEETLAKEFAYIIKKR